MNEFNFIHEDLPESDRDLFFGPLTPDDQFIVFDDSWTMAHIAVQVGLFPSLTQARKNWFNEPIPSGFTRHWMGKMRRHVCILNV